MILCISGKSKMRCVPGHGGMKCAYPFVGTIGEKEHAYMVLALRIIGGEQTLYYHHAGPHRHDNPITVWRAMRLLEMTKTSGEHALAACWSLFHPMTRTSFEDDCIKELAHQFHGEEGLQQVYEEIMDSFPSREDLEVLLASIFARGMYIDIGAVCREMSGRGINLNIPIIHKILDYNPPRPVPDARLGVGKMLAYFLGLRF